VVLHQWNFLLVSTSLPKPILIRSPNKISSQRTMTPPSYQLSQWEHFQRTLKILSIDDYSICMEPWSLHSHLSAYHTKQDDWQTARTAGASVLIARWEQAQAASLCLTSVWPRQQAKLIVPHATQTSSWAPSLSGSAHINPGWDSASYLYPATTQLFTQFQSGIHHSF
jgi:hypothetical protein